MSIRITRCLALLSFGFFGCVKQEPLTKSPDVSTEPTVQAEAARKEMQTLPKAFQTPDYFKKNDPTSEAVSSQRQQP